MKKLAVVGMLGLMAVAAQAVQYDITTLAGYGKATATYGFDGNWQSYSLYVPDGKVVLGAKLIDPVTGSPSDFIGAGFEYSQDFSVFKPLGNNGWTITDSGNGVKNSGVQIEVYYSDILPAYTVSSILYYNGAGGWGGWSAPAGQYVSGGGFDFIGQDISRGAIQSRIALEGSSWPNGTYGSSEQGWVVQGPGNNAQNPGYIHVISFNAPGNVPDGGTTMALLGAAILGLAALRRKMSL